MPEYIDKSQFSTRKPQIVAEDLPGEVWVPAFGYPNHEVSSLGRVRRRVDKTLIEGVQTRDGYRESELSKGKRIRFHRLVLQSFNPRDDWEDLTVDHINGIRSDNRLENLRWMSQEENTLAMLSRRVELQRELTRLINKMGYEATLAALQAM